jgi:hypothetical protein
VFAPGKSPVKVQPEALDISSLGEKHISLPVMNLTWTELHSFAFILHFFASFELPLDWFAVSVKQGLDHCQWLVLQLGWFAVSVKQGLDHCQWLVLQLGWFAVPVKQGLDHCQ